MAAARAAEDKARQEAAAKEAEAKEAAERQRIAEEQEAKAAAAREAEAKSKAAAASPPAADTSKSVPSTPHKAELVRETRNEHVARGPVVKRWVRRARIGRCRYAGQKIMPPGRYVVAGGDSLWRIALRHYRSGLYFMRIYRANRDLLRNPNRIYPCQRLYLPRKRG
jgi:nucleoid-associated protein YgaU